MDNELKKIFEEVAEKHMPLPKKEDFELMVDYLDDKNEIEVAHKKFIAGMELMYRALGWRDASEPPAEAGAYDFWNKSGYPTVLFYEPGIDLSRYTHWRRRGDLLGRPDDFATLEKLLHEQLKKGGKG